MFVNNETLEQELTMKTIIGEINFETKFSFLDDQAVETNILEGNFDAVKSYVLKYKTVNNSLTHNTEKNTMLHIAAKTNFDNIIQFLIKLNANTNAENKKGETPIFNAVKHNKINTIESITQINNLSINHKNKNGQTPIFKAIEQGNSSILLYLFNKGAALIAVDNFGNNLVHHSIIHHPKHDIVKFLVLRGVSLNDENKKKQSALDLINKKIKEFKKCYKDNQNNSIEFEKLNNTKQIKYFDEKTYHLKLAEMKSILTFINEKSFIEKNKGREVDNLSSNFESSPVELKDFICYKDFDKSNMYDRNTIIEGANTREQCKKKGGYPVTISNLKNETQVDIKYYNEDEIDTLKNKDLYYKQNYKKLQRRPDYVQEVIEEETKDHPHCNVDENNAKVIESFLSAKSNQTKINTTKMIQTQHNNSKNKCKIQDYTKYIVLFILCVCILVFVKNN